MTTSEMMKLTNKYYGKELNKADVETVFGKADRDFAETLRYFGWEVQNVADLFNAKSLTRYTANEIKAEKENDKLKIIKIDW